MMKTWEYKLYALKHQVQLVDLFTQYTIFTKNICWMLSQILVIWAKQTYQNWNPQAENTHLLRKGKYHCTVGLQFDWIGLFGKRKLYVRHWYIQKLLNPNQHHSRPAFSLPWMFSTSSVLFYHCSIILTESGSLFSCGWSADGQTGLEHYNNQSSPAKIYGDVKNEKIVKVSCTSDCVLALNGNCETSLQQWLTILSQR